MNIDTASGAAPTIKSVKNAKPTFLEKIGNGLSNGVEEVVESYTGSSGKKTIVARGTTVGATYVGVKKMEKKAIIKAATETGNIVIMKVAAKTASKTAAKAGLKAAGKAGLGAIAFIPDAVNFVSGFIDGYNGSGN